MRATHKICAAACAKCSGGLVCCPSARRVPPKKSDAPALADAPDGRGSVFVPGGFLGLVAPVAIASL